MNGMQITELAHLMEQERMRASLMAQANRARRGRQRASALRRLLGALLRAATTNTPRSGQVPPRPAIVAPGIRREAR